MFSILKLAAIRKFVNENMPDGMYFDVMENINLPSKSGDYAHYDAIVTVYSREHKEKLESLFSETKNLNVFVAYF